ncbi:HtaA domain-containing protein, partial [Streptomyces sp. YIM 98790]|uniref:HtaA domain-containing protein n=1 Tax=Streptomyces sp. YIM 98790 TaxID=2689077 RepID=UPI0014085764
MTAIPGYTARRGSLPLAAATATVLSVTAFAGPALADTSGGPGGAPGTVLDLENSTLDWGVKQSFRSYVTGPVGSGAIGFSGGATQNADGGFRFSGGTGTYDLATHGVDTAFQGGVRFTAHHGALDIEMTELRVVTEGRTGRIVADVTESGTLHDDVAFGTLDLSGVTPGRGAGGAMVMADVPATLTADGAAVFGGFYQAGADLDPVTLTVHVASGGNGSGGNTGGDNGGTGDIGDTGGTGGEPPAGPAAVVDGTLDWGVKESFRTYVTGPVAGGGVELSGGAAGNGDGGYRFPDGQGEFNAEDDALTAAFAGSVRFVGHEKAEGEYELDLTFSGLAVELNGTGGTLFADVTAAGQRSEDVPVAELGVPAGPLTPSGELILLRDVPAVLTEEGAEAFGGFYRAGDTLDPVTVAVALAEDVPLPGASAGGSGGRSSGGDDSGGSGGGAGDGGAAGGN